MIAILAGSGEVREPAMRRWLARSRVRRDASRREWLPRILEALGLPPPAGGLAGFRYVEQTGELPPRWIAAADPVWLEAEMNRLFLHDLPAAAQTPEDVREVFDTLRQALGHGLGPGTTGGRFEAIGRLGYLLADAPFAAAELSPALARGPSPERWLPAPRAAPACHRLLAEVQMCLHDAAVNRRRTAAGMPPLNALWVWGGGTAPVPVARPLPPLLADDPVLCGYWRCASGPVARWPGSVADGLSAVGGDFVALMPPGDPEATLGALQEGLARRPFEHLTLLFADGAAAEFRSGDRFRLWRRAAGVWPPES